MSIPPSTGSDDRRGLDWLVNRLDACGGPIDEATARRLLEAADLTLAELAPFVEQRSASYVRRCVVRRERYELLVLTWNPGQGSVAHDHSGSLCGLKVVRGRLVEQLFEPGPDGQVRPAGASGHGPGQILVDPGLVVHSLANPPDSGEPLVTVHLYSPPLPEVRRYAVASGPPAPLFQRKAPPNARVIAIIGGGFTGAMTLAQLLRQAKEITAPLHLVLIDRQPALGEGIAYRTNDPRHLLNVPAARMSAWPDRPGDFLEFARSADSSINPGDYLPRKLYGQYVRRALLDLAESADGHLSVELLRDDATGLEPAPSSSGWKIATASGRALWTDTAIITLGHRPPNDEFSRRVKGPRNRFIADPWAGLVLSQIGPDEPVLLLGSGLTAVDAILTLDRGDRTAPVTVVSRRGLLPQAHSREPKAADDVSPLAAQWLDPAPPPTVRVLVRSLRRHVARAASAGVGWRQVVDGLRPLITPLWGRLNPAERSRFLRHVRPFWEIHRHRMAPDVADRLDQLRKNKMLRLIPGTLAAAEADARGIEVALACRGTGAIQQLRVAWIINCTGPGVHHRQSTHPILRPLIDSGLLCADPFGLGLQTDAEGRALKAGGEAHSNLLIAGTLRKATLWESTAVPELRQQADVVARIALQTVAGDSRSLSDGAR